MKTAAPGTDEQQVKNSNNLNIKEQTPQVMDQTETNDYCVNIEIQDQEKNSETERE